MVGCVTEPDGVCVDFDMTGIDGDTEWNSIDIVFRYVNASVKNSEAKYHNEDESLGIL